MPLPSIYLWFLQALNVINASLELHRDSLCLKPLLARAAVELEGCDLNVALMDDMAAQPADYVTIRLQQGGFVVVSHACATAHIDWKASRRYLVDVARNPRDYLGDPDRIDLTWLQRRLGLPSTGSGSKDSFLSTGAAE